MVREPIGRTQGDAKGWLRVGTDRVRREADGLVVEAAIEMPDWRASRFRPTAIDFRGDRFAVRAYHHEPRGPHVYELEAWPDDGVEMPGEIIEYDDAFVRSRQQIRSRGRVVAVISNLASPLAPVLGLLPSGIQKALQKRIGLDPISATRASVTLENILAVLCGALAVVHLITGGQLTPELFHTLWLTPLLSIDAIVRFNAILREDPSPPGLLEWLIPARLRHPSRP